MKKIPLTDVAAPGAALTQDQSEAIARQLMSHLAQGGVLGDIHDFSERDYEVMYTLGHSLYTQARYPEAASVFGFLLLHNHQDLRFVTAYAAALQMNQDWGGAISLYTLAATRDMSNPAPCFHTCECLLGLGLKQQAAEGLAMVIRQCSASPGHEALGLRAQAMLDLISEPQEAA